MSSYTLNLKVEGGEISADKSLLTADSVEYITASFTFDESWTDLYKTAVFRVGELVYHAPLENNACNIPFEALKEPIMYISVYGVLNVTRATTTELAIQIQNSGYTVCTPSAPTPDPYNYFIERATELKNQSENYMAQCKSSVASAENFKNITEANLDVTNEAKNIAVSSSESASKSANTCATALSELSEHEKFLTGLSKKMQNAADSALSSASKAETAVLTGIENHNYEGNDLAHPNIVEIANTAKTIALGKANSLCFDTKEQLIAWTEGRFIRPDGKTTSDLNVGDNLYILEVDVPDYWWDGNSIQPLGTEKPDFSDYYTKSQIDARVSNATFNLISRSDYNALYSAGTLDAGRIYFVYEEG